MKSEITTNKGGYNAVTFSRANPNAAIPLEAEYRFNYLGLYPLLKSALGEMKQLTEKISQKEEVKRHRENIVRMKPFPRYLNRVQVIEYLGKEKILRILEEEYGLKPCDKTHKGTFYPSKLVEDLCILWENNLSK